MDSKTGFYITQSKHSLERSKYFDDESNNEDAEPSRRRAKREHQVEKPAAVIFTARSGRQWTLEEPLKRKVPTANILRQRNCIGRAAVSIQIIKEAFQLLITREIVLLLMDETN